MSGADPGPGMTGRAAILGLTLLAALVCVGSAAAHPLAPARLGLGVDAASGRVVAEWKTPLRRALGRRLEPIPPAGCGPAELESDEIHPTHRLQRYAWRCSAEDLRGSTLAVARLEAGGGAVLVEVAVPGLAAERSLLHAGRPSLVLARAADPSQELGRWTRLGVEHIASGFDHLLFVGALVGLLGFGRRTLFAITGFTLGHTLTLLGVVLGGLWLPTRPVEIAIAASLLWMAVELERARHRPQPGWLERDPFLVTTGFGLLHGLGFAGAFRALDLSTDGLGLPLLGFNLGVELGQGAFVLMLGGALLGVRRFGIRAGRAATLPGWALRNTVGALAAFWLIERTLT